MKLTDCDGMNLRVYRVQSRADFYDAQLLLKDHGYEVEFSTMIPNAHAGLEAIFGEFSMLSYMKSHPGHQHVIVIKE